MRFSKAIAYSYNIDNDAGHISAGQQHLTAWSSPRLRQPRFPRDRGFDTACQKCGACHVRLPATRHDFRHARMIVRMPIRREEEILQLRKRETRSAVRNAPDRKSTR